MSSRVYIGAKSFALKGTLLSKRTLETLAESTSLEELVNRLRQTQYSAPLSKLQPPFTARRLELAFRERFADVHFALTKAASRYELIKLYYLKNVAWNLKSALKSKALGKSYEESIEYLDLHSEELIGRRELIAKVLSAKDIQEAATLLSGTEFSEDIEKAVRAFSSTGETRLFDIYIDHTILSAVAKEYSSNAKFYSASRPADVAGIEDMVSIDIDSYNVLSVLRAKLWGLSADEIRSLAITPTYKVPLAVLLRMIGLETMSEAVKLFEDAYTIAQQTGMSDEELINAAEEKFASESRKTSSKAFLWQGLGPSNALAVVKLLEFEVRNLAAIAVGVEALLPAKEVLSKLQL